MATHRQIICSLNCWNDKLHEHEKQLKVSFKKNTNMLLYESLSSIYCINMNLYLVLGHLQFCWETTIFLIIFLCGDNISSPSNVYQLKFTLDSIRKSILLEN